jgi:hypothetical protein
MREREITGTAEELLGGVLAVNCGETITDDVVDEIMAYVDQVRALHGHRWLEVLRTRADGIDHGIPPIEPLHN